MDIYLRVSVAAAVIIVLTLYLYDSGAHRVYDIIFSVVVIVATCWLFGALAAISAIKNKRVFERADGDLRFSFPRNALGKLPFFLLVFVGRKNILPQKLINRKRETEGNSKGDTL